MRLCYMIVARSDGGGGLMCDLSVHNVIEDCSHNALALQDPSVVKRRVLEASR